MSFGQDVKYGVRMLARDPGFTGVMVIALALGIGVNTTVFTLVNAVLFRGLPFERADRVMYLTSSDPSKNRNDLSVSFPDFQDWRAQSKTFQSLAAFSDAPMVITDTTAAPERYAGWRLTANTFSLVGQKPLVGRDFLPEEDRPGAAPVCIIGYSVWESRYGRDPNVLGRSIRINEAPATIVGVMPQGMKFPMTGDLWTPLVPGAEFAKRDDRNVGVAGRLADGVSLAKAQEELAVIAQRLERANPKSNQGIHSRIIPYNDQFNGGQIRMVFLVLLGAVGFVLVIACANVANLLLARSLGRAREISIRTALGAGRWRVIRQLLVESVLVGVLGGAVGWLIAMWGVHLFDLATTNVGKPYWIEFRMDFTVFAYMAAICLTTGILFGLAPALQLSKVDLSSALKEGGRGASGGARARYLTGALVVTEVALSIVLLVGAGLMIRSFLNMYGMTSGLQAERFLVMRLSLPQTKYPTDAARVRFYASLEERLAAVPGVQSAVVTTSLPATWSDKWKVEMEGKPPVEEEKLPEVAGVVTSPSYLATIGIPVVRGRGFVGTDGPRGKETAIVNQRFAAKYWPGEDPLGKRIRVHWEGERPWVTVVGVNQDFQQTRPQSSEIEPLIYLPYRMKPASGYAIMARTGAAPKALTSAIRRAIQEIDTDLPVFDVRTLQEQFEQQRWAFRVFGTLFTVFALIALLLSSVGLYATMAYSVSRRTREIGVRMAMGASTGSVLRMVLSQGLRQLAIGLVLGLSAAFGLARVLKSLLVRVTPTDPTTFVTISAVLIAVGILACWMPARAAMKVDPTVALRWE
jgi:putative ABC transport system permease protein